MEPHDEIQDTDFNSAQNPFPEPQTIPSGWDTSELFAAPQTAAEQVDDWLESESE